MSWIKYSEKTPPCGMHILAFDGCRIYTAVLYDSRNVPGNNNIDFYCSLGCGVISDVTHWRLLPEKPTEIEKENDENSYNRKHQPARTE